MIRRLAVALATLAALVALPAPNAQAACGWSRVTVPTKNPANRLLSVDATSAGNAWILGTHADASTIWDQPQTWRWDGSVWTAVKTPEFPPNASATAPYEIAALDNGQAWFVGAYFIDFKEHPLLMHFEHGKWSNVPVPKAWRRNTGFTAIEARTPKDIWVGGNVQFGDAFALHFDGTSWHKTSIPSPDSTTGNVGGITAVPGSKFAWLAGTLGGSGQSPLLARWDGKKWKRFPVSQSVPQVILRAVDATSKNDVWAVGSLNNQTYVFNGVTLHFDGSAWSYFPSPDPSVASFGTDLNDVVALRPNDSFAVGTTVRAGGPSYVDDLFVQRWPEPSGPWGLEPGLPTLAYPDQGFGIARIPKTPKVWVVGHEWDGSQYVPVAIRGC